MRNEQEGKDFSKKLLLLFKDPKCPPPQTALTSAIQGVSAVNIALGIEDLLPEQGLLVFNELTKEVATEI